MADHKTGTAGFKHLGLVMGLTLLALGLWLTWMYSPRQISTEVIRIPRNAQQTLVVRLYLPLQTEAPYPTLMIWHGVSCTKETMEPWAIELARQGIAVMAPDAGGFGESYPRPYSEEENLADAKAITAYVQARPQRFDLTRLGVGGHSMGGAIALALASESPQITATLILGMSGDVSRYIPPNLFLGTGLYEQFHTPSIMRSMLQQATGQPAQEARHYGDVELGTARQLVISPTSDHLMEPFDPTLLRAAVAWSCRVFGLQTHPQPLMMSGFILGQCLILMGSVLGFSYGVRGNAFAQRYPRLVATGLILGVCCVLTLGMAGFLPPRLTTDLVLLAVVLFPIGHYAIRYPTQVTALFRMTALYGVLIVMAYAIVAVAFRSGEFITRPSLILGVPQFTLQMPLALLYSRIQELRAALFPVYSEAVVPGWGLLLLFLPDLIRPGFVVHQITCVAVWVARWLRQPLQIQWKERPSARSLQLLSGLLVLMLVILYQQMQAGAFSFVSVGTSFTLLVQMAILPALLILGMMRSPLFLQIEDSCWKR